jgi:uncharacterized protein YaiL (DUF2058 family)
VSDSLKDQLLKLGFKPPVRAPEPKGRPSGKPGGGAQRQGKPAGAPQHAKSAPRREDRPRGGARPAEPDLAQAYAIRAKTEREERLRAERDAQERAREKKARRAKLAALLEGKALNDAAADVARHFPHGDRIRRVYVTAEQLPRLNRGELGVVQLNGRYLVVERSVALEAGAIAEEALVLLPDPDAPAEDDIPADLVW